MTGGLVSRSTANESKGKKSWTATKNYTHWNEKKINSIQKNLWIPMIHRTLCARKFCGLTGLRVEVDSSLNVTKCSMKFRRNLNSFSRVLFRKTKTKSKTTPNQDKGNEVKSNCEFDSAIMITQTSKILILSFLIKLNLVG